MKFERARSEEQKELRLRHIKDVTLHLYNTVQFQDISMASIAKELEFTRGNLYKYYKTKEEILLDILSDKTKTWYLELEQALIDVEVNDIKHFCRVWAEVMNNNRDFLKLFSILFSIIEQNITLERLTDFKIEILQSNQAAAGLIYVKLPTLSEEDIIQFLNVQISLIVGLYPLSTPTPLQLQAIEKTGLPYQTPNFLDTFQQFLETYLKGLKKGI